MKTKYKIKLFNCFIEPYWMSKDNYKTVNHTNYDEYVIYDNEKQFKQILNDFIDAPNKKLTSKTVNEDFGKYSEKLSDSKIKAIMAYYNGRYDLSKKIYSDLKSINAKKIKKNFPIVLKYIIPAEMNYFSCKDNDPCDKLTKCIDSYIEIEISSED